MTQTPCAAALTIRGHCGSEGLASLASQCQGGSMVCQTLHAARAWGSWLGLQHKMVGQGAWKSARGKACMQ